MMTVPCCYLTFSDIILASVFRCLIAALWAQKSKLPTQPLQAWIGVRIQLFLWCLDEKTVFLKAFCLSKLSLSWSFSKRVSSWWNSLCMCPLVFLGCWFFLIQIWDMCRKKKTQWVYHHIISWVLSSLAELPYFYLSVFLCLFYK